MSAASALQTIGFFFGTYVVPAIFVVSFVTFLWGVGLYAVRGVFDEHDREKGKALMLVGVLVYFGMVVVWGVSALLFERAFDALSMAY